MKFYPYKKLFTRILSNDSLFTGLSSFQKEIFEVASILGQGDENSLILGDEIFSSTETESAVSLISGCIQQLHKMRSSFIFATHFKELYIIPEIIGLLEKI